MPGKNLLDQLCSQYRSDWRSGERPSVRDYLKKVGADRRKELAKRLIPTDVACRAKYAELPAATEYKRFGAGGIKLAEKAIRTVREKMVSESSAGTDRASEATPELAETVLVASQDTVDDGDSKLINEHSLRSAPDPESNTLGRFELGEVLGTGSFGKVYKAWDPHLERFVALKIPTFKPSEQKKIARFLSEAKSAGRLTHQNIVTTLESGSVGDQFYIASEFVEGELLSEKLERESLPVTEAVLLAARLADALNCAHESEVVHRDIKPENIVVDTDGQPHVMDFGIAKRLDDDEHMTTEGALLGSPAYMSPEQARGETQEVGPPSDQYSLGVVLFEMLSGSPPYDGPPHAVVLKVAKGPVPSVRSRNRRIDKHLDAIVRRAMAEDIGDRYAKCGDLSAELHAWLDGRGRPRNDKARVNRAARTVDWRRVVVWSGALGSTILGLILFGWWNLGESSESGSGQQIAEGAGGNATGSNGFASATTVGPPPIQRNDAADAPVAVSPGNYKTLRVVTRMRQEQRTRTNAAGEQEAFTVQVPYQEELAGTSDHLPVFSVDVSSGVPQLLMTVFNSGEASSSHVQKAGVTYEPTEAARGPGVPGGSAALSFMQGLMETRVRVKTVSRTVSEEIPDGNGGTEVVTREVTEEIPETYTVTVVKPRLIPVTTPATWTTELVGVQIQTKLQPSSSSPVIENVLSIDRIAVTLPDGVTEFPTADQNLWLTPDESREVIPEPAPAQLRPADNPAVSDDLSRTTPRMIGD